MKSKLLMLIISSFVFVGCTIDTKQKYSIEPSRTNASSLYVFNNQTGEVKICAFKGTVEDVEFKCTKTMKLGD